MSNAFGPNRGNEMEPFWVAANLLKDPNVGPCDLMAEIQDCLVVWELD
jgi:hypothetical protein